MIYIYRQAGSDGARALAEAVGGRRIRRFRHHLSANDHVVCWGEINPFPGICSVLNGGAIRSKYQDALTLKAAGVSTIEVALQQPEEEHEHFYPLFERASSGFNRAIDPDRVKELIAELTGWLVQHPNTQVEWLGRKNSHIGGDDLLAAYGFTPDFWVKKESIVLEYRVHSFLGRSIRGGIKEPWIGGPAHPWIRSYDAGWRIHYGGIRQDHRNIAHAAVKALGLDFGAVDIGERADGSLIVLEVNRAPGLEGGTISAYASAITQWARGGQ